MLPEGKNSKEVYLGEKGIINKVSKNCLLIDCSTIDIQTSIEIGKKAKEKGWIFVDRKNLDYLPKGTKVKPFTSKEGKKGGSYWNKWIRYFNKKIFDEPFFDDVSKKK